MPEAFAVRAARPDEYQDARAFYLACGYDGGIRDEDRVLLARAGPELVGVVRLSVEQGVTMLRGMQVHPDWQRRGIGRALLGACLPPMRGVATYCLPYSHLLRFYEGAGFREIEPERLPGFIAERLAAYRAQGQSLVAMLRLPGGVAEIG